MSVSWSKSHARQSHLFRSHVAPVQPIHPPGLRRPPAPTSSERGIPANAAEDSRRHTAAPQSRHPQKRLMIPHRLPAPKPTQPFLPVSSREYYKLSAV
jgi:hypothetical protein